MKDKQLYTKNEKTGRYEKYTPEVPKYDNALYRKIGKKYVPTNIYFDSHNFSWQEGVFAVTRTGRSLTPNCWTSADYLQKIFKMYKCGDIENVSIGKLAGMNKLSEYLALNWEKISGDNVYEMAASIVAILMSYENEKNTDDK